MLGESGSSINEEEDGVVPIAGFASAAERAAYVARMRASPEPLMLLNAVGDEWGPQAVHDAIVSLEPAVGDKRSARDAPDTSSDDGCRGRTEYRGISKSEDRDEREQAEMGSKELRRDGEAHNLSREERLSKRHMKGEI